MVDSFGAGDTSSPHGWNRRQSVFMANLLWMPGACRWGNENESSGPEVRRDSSCRGCRLSRSADPILADGLPTAPIIRLELGMHSAQINQVGTDAQGRFVLTASNDKTARLWDVSSGQLLRIFRVPSDTSSANGELNACALSPDGRLVAVGGYDGNVYLFDRQSGAIIRRLSGLGSTIERILK
jgi:WD40 repeat protein